MRYFPPARAWILLLLALATGGLTACGASNGAQQQDDFSRTQVRVLGSSTVYPFSSYAAEELGVITDHRTPIIESTGTGGGMQVFCSGVGEDTPDIINASRRMKPAEWKRCQKHGVRSITEIVFGSDGIVLIQDKDLSPLNLSLEQLTLAVAKKVPHNGKLIENPYEYWDQIDPSLPHREILIYGPPTSSGTRDAFESLAMGETTPHLPVYDGSYTTIRRDGAYAAAAENDNLTVQKVARSDAAIGIVGFSYLDENRDVVEAVTIGHTTPTPDTIANGRYPLSRSLWFYVKNAHVDNLPAIDAYVQLILSDRMSGPDGVLKSLGLIPLPQERRQQMRKRWQQREQVTLESLQQ
ncbi:MAG TPA: substrate-binding domain-containing protein [Salinisphaeraceae bacterium]|nr:substrate-binding domain-containing protein [Salinisphaeraceae bacterium]